MVFKRDNIVYRWKMALEGVLLRLEYFIVQDLNLKVELIELRNGSVRLRLFKAMIVYSLTIHIGHIY